MALTRMDAFMGVKICRSAQTATYRFIDYFQGFEEVAIVRRLFGEETEAVLRNLRVEFSGRRGYMGVSDNDGHLIVSAQYLNHGDILDIYLDVIHELVHVKQFMEGKELFDQHYSYVERPTEVEAYRYAVEEARNLGLNDARILAYLQTEWMSDEDLACLAHALDIPVDASGR
jgi:hypothetical protein